jgi:hypothetical protein
MYRGLYQKNNYVRNSILPALSWSISYCQLRPLPSKSMDKLDREGKQYCLLIVDECGAYW